MSYRLITGDCREVLAGMEPESVHAVVADPPYHLTTVSRNGSARINDESKPFGRHRLQTARTGFMNQSWDGGDVAMDPATWTAVLRVLKPGGHLIALCGTRTEHRVVCAIEDAGFEIRDRLLWLYGSGFPKSHDVSKAIDRAAGAEREVVGENSNYREMQVKASAYNLSRNPHITAPATEAARQWQGWGTALKPAVEIAVLARKPLSEGSVAANVLAHGTGALNVDACRVATDEDTSRASGVNGTVYGRDDRANIRGGSDLGRWPPNVLHDGSPEVIQAFARFGEGKAGTAVMRNRDGGVHNAIYGAFRKPAGVDVGFSDTGTAARFFPALGFSEDELRFLYEPKADRTERAGTTHPTVKPIALMEWLVRLVTPPGGVVLDPFAGSGSTLIAAERLGFESIGIEQDAKTVAEAEERIRRFRARRAIGPGADRVPVLDGQGVLL